MTLDGLSLEELRGREEAQDRLISFLMRERDKVRRAIAVQVPPPDMPSARFRSRRQQDAFSCPRCGFYASSRKAAA